MIAVERNGEVVTDVGPDTTVRTGDTLVVVGTDDAVAGFTERFT